MMATAGKVTVAEVEKIWCRRQPRSRHIHTPGIYVDRIIQGKSSKSA
jgi:3-oxoacid CoA-transferase subunit A